MADQFSRPLSQIEQQLTMASSRRAAALAARDQADTAVQHAIDALDAAVIEAAMRARHVDLCGKQIDALLDERLRSRATDQMPSGAMT